MSEKCPECNHNLVELYTAEEKLGTDQTGLNIYYEYKSYGYWCPNHEKMFVKKHKSWLEQWSYPSSNHSTNQRN